MFDFQIFVSMLAPLDAGLRNFFLRSFFNRVSGFALGPRVAIVEVGDVCVTIRL